MNSFKLITTPKESNVYRKHNCCQGTTPPGSNNTSISFFYIDLIPLGLVNNDGINLKDVEV